MASEVLKALFTAEETISDALSEIRRASSGTEDKIDEFSASLGQLNGLSHVSDRALSELRNSSVELSESLDSVDSAVTDASLSMRRLDNGIGNAHEEAGKLRNSLMQLSAAGRDVDNNIDDINKTLVELTNAGEISEGSFSNLRTTFNEVSQAGSITESQIDDIVSELVQTSVAARDAANGADSYGDALNNISADAMALIGPNQAVASSMDSVERQAEGASEAVDDVRNSSIEAAGALTLLNAKLKDSALSFGSLSVNIGPFNLALRNFVTQVPAILTGMGSILALVSSLIVAFTTLGAVSGALFAGGALAFFEDFSSQFEESGEALQAFSEALQDLFVDALEPLMTEANMDLFIDTINAAARAVNRFAQFASMMREEVLSTLSRVEGDADDFFNAMRNTFIMLEPVMIGFMNFFLQDLPVIIERFAVLTRNIDGDIAQLIQSLGGLMSQLLDFANTVISAVTPIIVVLINTLTSLFAVINSLPSGLVELIVMAGLMAVVVAKLISVIIGLSAAMFGLNALMIEQAAAGTLLGSIYTALATQAQAYAAGEIGLATALKASTLAIWNETTAAVSNAASKAWNATVTQVLRTATMNLAKALRLTWVWLKLQAAASYLAAGAKYVLSGALLASVAGFLSEAAATGVATTVMSAYATVTSIAAAATSVLVAALSSTVGIALMLVTGIALILGGLAELAGFNVVGGIIGFFKDVISLASEAIQKVAKLLGLGGRSTGDMPGVADTDAIQTNPNIDLSFEDNVENNVEMKADPEDKAQMSRIAKDAIEEANSFTRRHQGGQ